jgi:hypothetical protein
MTEGRSVDQPLAIRRPSFFLFLPSPFMGPHGTAMRPHRARSPLAAFALLLASSSLSMALAQEYKVEAMKEPPPSDLAPAIRETLVAEGFKVVDGEGKPYAEIWLRKAVPASAKPGAPSGAILFPFVAEGELLGALRFPDEGHDYRDQTIARGVYTLRYGIQPVNGDHLGVSPYRDYMLLLPAAKDKALANLAKKPLEDRSAESAGTSHPAILMLLKPASGAKPGSVVRDQEKDTWGAVLPLKFEVKGSDESVPLNFLLIVVGAAMA